jgi:hypothetical protein
MKGPFPIICRGHSGGRLLAEAFYQNGFWMGVTNEKTKDDMEFSQRISVVRELAYDGFRYPNMRPAEQERVRQKMRALVETSKNHCPNPADYVAFGWKRAVTTFMVEITMDAYPQAKVVHLIRDGRDTMLSRLDSRMRKLDDPGNRLMIFGDEHISHYRGRPLTREVVEEYRNEIEMHHWATAVRFGMRGRKYEGRYMEVLYEDLCSRPAETLGSVFEFLEVPYRPQAREWVVANASAARMGKWKSNHEELKEAIAIGAPLLQELGYV